MILLNAKMHECIDAIDVNLDNYSNAPDSRIKVKNGVGNDVFHKGIKGRSEVLIDFKMGIGSKVLIGEGFSGSIDVRVLGSHCLLYIGSNVRVNELTIKLRSGGSRMFVGNFVTTSGINTWINGSTNAEGVSEDVVIGDDCMFSWGITLRNTDAHPVYDTNSWVEMNPTSSPLIIEPHCWIGQNASVLKNVTVGACSIVGFGAVVTKSTPRFSAISGVPATIRSIEGRLWSRGVKRSINTAVRYLERFAEPGSYTMPEINTSAAESDGLFDD